VRVPIDTLGYAIAAVLGAAGLTVAVMFLRDSEDPFAG
jgi:hypothetical protein